MSVKICLKALSEAEVHLLSIMLTRQKRAALIIYKKNAEALAYMNSQVSQMARKVWTVWLVHFAERIKGKLTSFNCTYFSFHMSGSCVSIALSDALHAILCRCIDKKGDSCAIATFRAHQKFIHMSEGHLGAADWPLILHVYCMAYNAKDLI